MATSSETIPATNKELNESAANDPDFAVICAFLQKFAKDLGVDLPNFNHLHEWLVNTDEVSPQLRDLHIKLLRKTRKTVHEKSWESALSKFCFWHSAQDAWEIERFGYKKSSLKVKLRILRELLESQFERNNKFRSRIQALSADSLRSQPIGRDKLGHNYWLTQDDDCNLRIYQEHLDEEIWRVVATNREELVNLISRLRGNEVVLPSTDIGIVDEDTSSSNSCAAVIERPPPPEEQDDSQEEPAMKVPNIRIRLGVANKNKVDHEEVLRVVTEQTANDNDEILRDKIDSKKDIIEEDSNTESKNECTKKVKPLVITQLGGNSPNIASVTKRRQSDDIRSSPPAREEQNVKRLRPLLLDSRRSNKPSKYFKREEEASSSIEDELEDDEEEGEEEDIDSVAAEEDENEEKDIEEYDDDFEGISEAVEDPPVYVRGNGSGKDCDLGNDDQSLMVLSDFYDFDEPICGELIEEPVLLIVGEGNGFDCLVGNKNEENVSSPKEPKATFFFGEPGCLKLSPIKLNSSPTASNKADDKITEEDESEKTECDSGTSGEMKEANSNEMENSKKLESYVVNDTKSEQIEINGDKGKVEEKNESKNEEDETNNPDTIPPIESVKAEKEVEKSENKTQSSNENQISTNIVHEKEEELLPPPILCESELSNTNAGNESVIDEKQCSSGDASFKSTSISTRNDIVLELPKELENETICEEVMAGKEDKTTIQFAPDMLNPLGDSILKNQLLKKELPHTLLPSATKACQESNLPNRKRRLVDLHKSMQSHQTTSDSDLDIHADKPIESSAKDDVLQEEDIGGKRLKMRSKCSNSEIRKKIEAKLDATLEETTSSSGDEETRRPRKTMTPKKETEKLSAEAIKIETNINSTVPDVITPIGTTVVPIEVVPTTSTAATIVTKQKPTLSEIIEKKLKKTPPKSSDDICNVFTLPQKKTPITKPLKKNLLTQLRESDEEAVPRKRILGNAAVPEIATIFSNADAMNLQSKEQTGNSITLNVATVSQEPQEQPVASLKLSECSINDAKSCDRQRKRQNSEEPSTGEVSSPTAETSAQCQGNIFKNVKKSRDDTIETEAKKLDQPLSLITDVAKEIVEEKMSIDAEKPSKNVDIAEETSTVCSGRRSSRRSGASVVYSELPQVKRTRAGAKPAAMNLEKVEETPIKTEIKTEKSTSPPLQTLTSDKTLEEMKDSVEILETPPKNVEIKIEEKPNILSSSLPNEAEKPSNNNDDDDNVEDQIKANFVKKPPVVNPGPESESVSVSSTPPPPASVRARIPRKKREVDTTNIIDEDSETPVRQSRRIAQQKIREEAERRKLEEIALRSMKQELKKKKKAEKEADPTVAEPSEHSSSSSSESEVETQKKKSKKKLPGKDGWSSGSEEVEEPEEEDEYPHHYETDAGSPLFKSDHEFSPESDLEDETQVVPTKRARTARKEDAAEDDTDSERDEEACQKCGKSDHPEWILLCDICDKGYHCSCLSPVIFYIPEGNWYCPPCQQEQLIAALEKQLVEFDEIVEKKRIAHEEEKRLAELEQIEEQARLKAEEEQRKERRKNKQKKRHRDGNSSDGSINSSGSDKGGNEKGKELRDTSEKGSNKKQLAEDDDDSTNDRSGTVKANNKRNEERADKHKRRRHGKGRNRRRRAAARGTRRRRRLDKSSGSGSSGSNSDNDSDSSSGSDSESSSDTFSDSDDEPIYKLRKRRQINVSYRLNEYDDLIKSALKKEMDEVAGAGNAGRGKDITTIIEADKEEKARLKQIEEKENGNGNTVVNEDDEGNQKQNEISKTEKIINEPGADGEASATAPAPAIENQNDGDEDDDEKPLKNKGKTKPATKKKPRKLTTLDISSEEDDASDEDFKTSSYDDEEEDEDTSISASSGSDTSLEVFRRRGKAGKKKQRKAARRAARERRKVKKFVVDESDDDDEVVNVKKKKKRKDDSDYTESETDDNELSELSENIDSADLCDDTTSESSDGAWQPSKRKKQRKASGGGGGGGNAATVARNAVKSKKTQPKKVKQLEYSDDDISETEQEDDDDDDDATGGKGSGKQPRSVPLIPVGVNKSNNGGKKGKPSIASKKHPKQPKKKQSEEELSFSDSEDSTRRTRGRRYAYIEDFDDDSSDGGIKPGVKRPDTPPEEREKFIKKQEEIKRMLAEKNAEGAKLAATPRLTPIKAVGGGTLSDKDKRSPAKSGQDSLSTVPLSVIRQAKVLDIDYLQRKGEAVGDIADNPDEVDSEFDDADLPDDLPEDMDEDAIARMVEEEDEFVATAGSRELPPPDEVLRTPNKSKAAKDNQAAATPTSTPSAAPKSTTNPSLEALSHMQGGGAPTPAVSVPPVTGSGLQEPTRKRLPMPTLHPPLLRHQYPHSPHTQAGNIMLHGVSMPRHPPPPSSHLLQNALSAPLGQPLNRNFPIQHAHAMPARQLLPPTPRPVQIEQAPTAISPVFPGGPMGSYEGEMKPRGRRKKITPLRDPIQKQIATSTATTAPSASAANVQSDKKSLAEPAPLNARVSTVVSSVNSVIKTTAPILSVSQPPPPSLYKPQTNIGLGNEAAQPSVITRMPHLPPARMIFPGADVARFYNSLPHPPGATGPPRQITPNSQRPHRGPPLQMPPGLPPPPISTSSYVPQHSRHPPAHLNPYRPPIYGNPNFGQPSRSLSSSTGNIRLGTPTSTGPDYLAGPRPFPPYGYYPPPPPLTSAHISTPPSSVIVAAPPASSNPSSAPSVVTQTPTISTLSSHGAVELTPSINKKPMTSVDIPPSSSKLTSEPPTKLMTLEVYTTSSAKSPLAIGGGESSCSQPDTAEDSPTSVAQTQSKAGEFSGLVSYFSSQHDDYNT